MIHLTLKHGLCPMSPLAFAFYGEVKAGIGQLDLSHRLGMCVEWITNHFIHEQSCILHMNLHLLHVVMFLATGNIAMKLLDKKDSASLKATVFAAVYHLIFWSSVPLQSIVDAHKIGYKGMRCKSELVKFATNF